MIPPPLSSQESRQILGTRRSDELRHQSHSRDAERDRETHHAPPSSTSETRRSLDHKSDDRTVFSALQQLQPTFSPKIVRTPNHYVSTTVSSASAAAAAAAAANKTPGSIASSTVRTPASVRRPTRDDEETPSPPRSNAHTHGPIYGPPTPLRPTMTGSSTSNTPARQLSAPSTVLSTSTSLAMSSPQGDFTEEPDTLLSPILGGTLSRGSSESLSRSRTSPNVGSGDPSPSREVSRSQTYPLISSSSSASRPAAFSPIPEERERTTPSYESSVSKQRTPRPSPKQIASQADRSQGTREKHSPSYTNSHSREHSTSYTSSQTRDPSPMLSSTSTSLRDHSSSHHSTSTPATSPYRYNTEPAPPVRKSSSAESASSRPVTRSHTYPSLDGTSSSYSSRSSHSPLPSPNRAHSRSRHTSPIRSGGYSRNPLPDPPELVPSAASLLNSFSSSFSSAAAAASQSRSHSHSRRPSQSPSSTTALSRSQTQPVIGASQTSGYYPTQPVTPSYTSPQTTSQTSQTTQSAYPPSSYSSSRSNQHTSSQSHSSHPSYSSTHATPSSRPSHSHSSSYASHSRSSSQQPPQIAYSSASQSVNNAHNASLRTRESSPNPPRSEPPRPSRVRHGYWNRRGDHLLIRESSRNASPRDSEMYIVYAPRALANPPELNDYPSATEGFRNHEGKHVKYDPNIPELPDSLPRHGEEPRYPYESVSRLTCLCTWV